MIDATFKTTITLYSHYLSENKENRYKRTVLHNCFVANTKANVVSDTTKTKNYSFVCRIPENPLFSEDFDGSADTFGISPGDVIVIGEVSDIVEDIGGHRIANLLQKYSERAFTVTQMSNNTLLPFERHYRVVGE